MTPFFVLALDGGQTLCDGYVVVATFGEEKLYSVLHILWLPDQTGNPSSRILMRGENHSHSEDSNRYDAGARAMRWVLPLVVVGALALVAMVTVAVLSGIYVYQVSREQPIVRVTIFYPGMPVDVMEQDVTTRVARWCGQAVGIQEILTVTTEGRTEVYVTGQPGTDPQALLRGVRGYANSEMFYLPTGATLPSVMLLADNETIPKVQIREVPKLTIKVDREVLARYGISAAEFASALQDSKSGRSGDLRPDTLLTIGEQTYRLNIFAKFVLEAQPSHLVNTYPSQPDA